MEAIEILDDKDAKAFVGTYKPEHHLLDLERPVTVGALDLPDYYFEHRRQLAEAVKDSKAVIEQVGMDFGKRHGRTYGLFEKYMSDDADLVVVAMGSTAGTAKVAIDALRKKGVKAGLVKPRIFRPFPREEMATALKGAKAIAVMDRSDSLSGHEGQLCTEIKAALYDKKIDKTMLDYIYGLGGREIKLSDIEHVYAELSEAAKGKVKPGVSYLGVRE
jgi:pyruvate ferredoxin oxidoreductase alpha subunit